MSLEYHQNYTQDLKELCEEALEKYQAEAEHGLANVDFFVNELTQAIGAIQLDRESAIKFLNSYTNQDLKGA